MADKAPVSQTVPTQPQDNTGLTEDKVVALAPAPAVDSAAQAALDAREAELVEREKQANAILARAEAVAKSVEDSLKQAQTVSRPVESVEADNTEKSNIVTMLLNKAFADKDLGAVKSFTPSVTMANNTPAGLITFEKDVEYKLPEAIISDLERRQKEHLAYKESVNIRSVVNTEVGRISGAGK